MWAGYKKSLGEDDLADLNPRDVSANVVPKFNRSFDPKLAAARLSCKDTAPAAANVSFGANAEEVKFNTGNCHKIYLNIFFYQLSRSFKFKLFC